MKISIIVPVYNTENYLRCCLDSLVNQTYENLEIIVIDDASTDNSRRIIEEYAQNYPDKIKAYFNPVNIGQGATRNKGISLSTGDYIGFVDSDDYVALNMYEVMYHNAFEYGFPDIICADNSRVTNSQLYGSTIEKRRPASLVTPSMSKNQILSFSPACWDKLFRKDILAKDLFIENCLWEDIAFTYGHLFNANQIVVSYEKSYFYRNNPNGLMASGRKINLRLPDIFRVLDHFEEVMKQQNNYSTFISQIKSLQVTRIMYRLEEISKWDIKFFEKLDLYQLMLNLLVKKYDPKGFVNPNIISFQVSPFVLNLCSSIIVDEAICEKETMEELKLTLKQLK